VDGTLLPCWSWAARPELYSGKHKATGMKAQVACTLYGKLAWISDPVNGSRHDNYGLSESGVPLMLDPVNWIGDLVTDRVVPVFGPFVLFGCSRRVAALPDVPGAAPAPTAPGWPPFRVAGTGWLVRRVQAGRIAAASRSGRRLSRARSGGARRTRSPARPADETDASPAHGGIDHLDWV
jgi:hypothetical protein